MSSPHSPMLSARIENYLNSPVSRMRSKQIERILSSSSTDEQNNYYLNSKSVQDKVKQHCGQYHEDAYAKVIMLHEPDMPMFMGSLHPDGSLYANAVDLKKAQMEHQELVCRLQKHGIQTLRVRDVLAMDCDEDLRERLRLEGFAMGCLQYKLDATYQESHSFNALTENDKFLLSDAYKEKILSGMSVDQLVDIVLTNPTIHLKKSLLNTALTSTGITFAPLSNLVFCRDQQITTRKGVVMAQLASSTRLAEVAVTKFCFEKMGMQIIGEVPIGGFLEGGDFFPCGDFVMVGMGLRTNFRAIDYCMKHDLFGTRRVAIVKDCFDWQQERMHLDTIFNIVHQTACVLLETTIGMNTPLRRLVDVYEKNERGEFILTVSDMEFSLFLKNIGFHIIPLSQKNQEDYGLNFLNIGNGHIIIPDMESARKIAKSEFGTGKIEVIDYSHVSHMYGSIHCSTQVICRSSKPPKVADNPEREVMTHIRSQSVPPPPLVEKPVNWEWVKYDVWPNPETAPKSRQITDRIVLVPPTGFAYNVETATDNSFMCAPHQVPRSQIQKAALREYSMFHQVLAHDYGIIVHTAINDRDDTPDAVFPNNWFSTHSAEEMSGSDTKEPTLIIYPMKHENRSKERIPETMQRLHQHYKNTIDLTDFERSSESVALEGTGVFVLDRSNRIAYMCESPRADKTAAEFWLKKTGYKELVDCGVATDLKGASVYHTNVVMGIGSKIAVVCLESISDAEKRKYLEEKLSKTHEIIAITRDQMHNFCGNVVELWSPTLNGPILVMSETARSHFTHDQLDVLKRNGVAVCSVPIPTLEKYGGGSVRCCIAELF
eukprot:TRINITY_DN4547_c0_g1_i1.p1 TRINITY_DN4547_c0_g1~~TRINITY_DN4547_c0_g1_i1.p1  ORF type:complete len:828 (+),score=180.71 TRINITY_DN4547_c0_g1_i1:391-2874(+)